MSIRRKWAVLTCCCLAAAVIANGVVLQAQTEAGGREEANVIVEKGAAAETARREVTISSSAAATPAGMRMIAANGELELLLNDKTTEVAVREKRSGRLWSSNPPDREEDPIAASVNKAELASQLIVSYYNDRGHESFINNVSESVAKGQFEIVPTANGVRVVYEIGSSDKGLGAIPKAVGKTRFEERILGQIEDDSVRSRLRSRFFFNEAKNQYERKEMQDYIVKDVVAILESIGYTPEEAKLDNESAGAAEERGNLAPRFVVPIDYELEGGNLVVRIDTALLEDTEAFPLHKLQLLPFFGAAGMREEGYMFVPDGSGALIALNDTNKGARAYEAPLYGEDQTPLASELVQAQYTQLSRLPVFGMKQGDHAMFAIIEQGDAMASILADTSGKLNGYNRVGASFRIKNMEPVEFRAGSVTRQIPKYSQTYDGGIAVRYGFLAGESADYVGMAHYYRNYLVERYGLTRVQKTSDTPFVLELIGSIPVRQTFLGIPYKAVEPVTTFGQAMDLLDALQARGIYQIRLKYSGWFNKGYYHSLPDTVKPDSALGGRKGFADLIAYVRERNIELYPDAAFQRVYVNGKGFRASRDAARFLNRKSARSYSRDIVTTNPDSSSHYLLSPRKLTDVVSGFLDDYAPFRAGGVSLRDLGEDLNSDVTPRDTLNRQEAVGIVTDVLREIEDSVGRILVNGGNAYAIPYAGTIANAPLESSKFNIASEEVPFYSIVLRGYADLAGAPINHGRDQDPRSALLKMLETGSFAFYQWFYEQPTVIRDTRLNHLYSSHYGNWLEEAVGLYKEANAVLSQVQGQTIAGHRKLADGVYETTYEKGLKIIVNYNKAAVTAQGTAIEARGYRVIGGEGG
ncbi:hypothetical protein B1A99_06880 [Cohnella sp. CIP 111063]|uniref:DUF5696 domain-containing protein n=1 Tax=unclassified Cohnella TaxID=2636738 RepID=UPI000B8BE1A8|nr:MULTISPECIES: DUF5696 domain-containing protein [unclassified Cohnella]OXS61232.1 hypothetical protein B1A99_06880 [Cohnella sp. CIP 111063]PRX73801.1 hypothetical protein B0G52_103401 [Cohnella sp. SGD-V74]